MCKICVISCHEICELRHLFKYPGTGKKKIKLKKYDLKVYFIFEDKYNVLESDNFLFNFSDDFYQF